MQLIVIAQQQGGVRLKIQKNKQMVCKYLEKCANKMYLKLCVGVLLVLFQLFCVALVMGFSACFSPFFPCFLVCHQLFCACVLMVFCLNFPPMHFFCCALVYIYKWKYSIECNPISDADPVSPKRWPCPCACVCIQYIVDIVGIYGVYIAGEACLSVAAINCLTRSWLI